MRASSGLSATRISWAPACGIFFKYSKAYSGSDPEFIEGDAFRIIVPLDEALCGVIDSAVDKIPAQTTQSPTQTTQIPAQPEGGQDAVGMILGLIMADQGITQKAIADKLGMNVNTA